MDLHVAKRVGDFSYAASESQTDAHTFEYVKHATDASMYI